MNDWVNCLRLVAFGQSSSSQSAGGGGAAPQPAPSSLAAKRPLAAATGSTSGNNDGRIDALLDKRIGQKPEIAGINRAADYARSLEQANGMAGAQPRSAAGGLTTSVASAMGGGAEPAPQKPQHPVITTASQAAIAAANALAKTRQRQPSLLGSCKPQPPTDSPFIQAAKNQADQEPLVGSMGCLDTLTPTVRGQLIMGAKQAASVGATQQQLAGQHQIGGASQKSQPVSKAPNLQASLDEEEENMLYCSIEDNPSEHNYRVKVIETELSLRCQLKCYQLTASTTISQQYEQLGHFSAKTGAYLEPAAQPVTFYQLIVGPQELTLLNDYAAAASLLKRPASQQQGLWSWPYQCIRRYGFDKDNCFMFEAGRKCTSGPGQFIVQTPKAYNIYQDVVKFVNELRSLSTCASSEPGNQEAASATSAAATSTGAASSSGGANNAQQREKQQVVVTQIPVTWAPSSMSSSHGINIETTDNTTRQQFFDTLRQLESTGGGMQSSKGNQSINNNNNNNIINNNNNNENMKSRELASSANSPQSSTTSHNQPSSSSSSAASSPTSVTRTSTQRAARSPLAPNSDGNTINKPTNKCDTNSSTATSEETDESGYEQGDDSVDSSRFKLKSAGCNATRKRQANDSMSSSSSTSSSNAGSPGHSVSRRSTSGASSNCSTASNGQGPSKRSPLMADATQRTKSNGLEAKPTNASHKLSGLHSLIVEEALGAQPEDFEANLIRDVYSEITKLHAKFAVTSGSAEDLMSSNSSNNGSAASSNNSCSSHNGDAEDCAGGTLSSDGNALNPMNEPMYTNLKLANGRRARSESFVHLIDDGRDEDDEEEEEEEDMVVLDGGRGFGVHSRLQHPSSYSHENIPQSRVPQHPSYAQNQFDYLSPRCGGPIYPTILNPIPECGELASSQPPKVMPKPSSLQLGQRLLATNNHSVNYVQQNNRQQLERADPFKSKQQTGSSVKSKLPTNHYVINDVQYAKISRNIRAKYESCL